MATGFIDGLNHSLQCLHISLLIVLPRKIAGFPFNKMQLVSYQKKKKRDGREMYRNIAITISNITACISGCSTVSPTRPTPTWPT